MAKVKSKFFNAIQNPLAGRGHGKASVSSLTTAFYTHGSDIIMRTKPKQPPHTSAVQLSQRELWTDADCMWKGKTWGQYELWWNYYVQEYEAGRTIYTGTTKLDEAGQQIPHKDMGKVAYFMNHALRLDLLDYIEDFLLSSWLIISLHDTGEAWDLTAGLTNPPELTEAVIFQERLPVRGL